MVFNCRKQSGKDDYERAIRYYDTVIKLKPDYASVYNNRGIAYYSKSDFDRAIKDFEVYYTIIELDPEYAKMLKTIPTSVPLIFAKAI